jgi:hypothetical protein
MSTLDLFQVGFLIIVVVIGIGGMVAVLFKKDN